MKSLRLHGPCDLRLHEEPEPQSGPGEEVVRVRAVGLCGSDLTWYSDARIGGTALERPIVLGHETVGEILTGERAGERVVVDPLVPCGTCSYCLNGNRNLCLAHRFAGHGLQDGGLREKMVWPLHCLHTLPDTMTDDEGVMLEPLAIALHAIDLGKLKRGMRVGVFGCGPIGLLIIRLARRTQARRILATEELGHRIEAARAMGADQVFSVVEGDERGKILAATEGQGVDVAFEAAGENEAVETAIFSARPGARVILIGIPGDDRTSFQASEARRKGLTIKLCRRTKRAYPEVIQMAAEGGLDIGPLVSSRFDLEDYDRAFQFASRREGLKVVIHPSSRDGQGGK